MTNDLLLKTQQAFQQVKGSVVQAMQYLWLVKEEEAWKEVSETFSDYIRDHLDISQGFASKLLAVNKHYLIEGAVSPEHIVGLDYEKLYIAQQTAGTAEEHIEKARLLSRRELREEKVDDGHIHEPETIEIYKCCGMRVEHA